MNNDNDLNLHSMTKLSGWLRYWTLRFYACFRCKSVTNIWYVKNTMNCDENMYWVILHLPRVELHCKLQEKLHRVTGPLRKRMIYTITCLSKITV